MLNGERRPVHGRRGMTVLGKIPTVPKPINLPSQRSENGGLDINVMIVPRGSSSWGSAGRSQTSGSPWGNYGRSPLPSVASDTTTLTAGGSIGQGILNTGYDAASGATCLGWQASQPLCTWKGTRPLSAGSLCVNQEAVSVASTRAPASLSSDCETFGHTQSQPVVIRPPGAETSMLSAQCPSLTRCADQSNKDPASLPAWGGAQTGLKWGEGHHQPPQFTFTRVDFPTLGSRKNSDLLSQPKIGRLPVTSIGAFGCRERMSDGLQREGQPHAVHKGLAEGNRQGDAPRPSPYVGQRQPADSWRGEDAQGTAAGVASHDYWRRGAPSNETYGSHRKRVQLEPASLMRQLRNGTEPGAYAGGEGPFGRGTRGDVFGNYGRCSTLALHPGQSIGPVGYLDPGPSDNSHDFSRPGGVQAKEMVTHRSIIQPDIHRGLPRRLLVNDLGLPPQGRPWQGLRNVPHYRGMSSVKCGPKVYKGDELGERARYACGADCENGNVERLRLPLLQGSGGSHGPEGGSPLLSVQDGSSSRGGNPGSHRDWGAVVSNDEPMDFSKPVFEEDVLPESPSSANQRITSEGMDDGTNMACRYGVPAEQVWIQNCNGVERQSAETKREVVACSSAKTCSVQQDSQLTDVRQGNRLQTLNCKVIGAESVLTGAADSLSVLKTVDQVVQKVTSLDFREPSETNGSKDGMQTQKTMDTGCETGHLDFTHQGKTIISEETNSLSNAFPARTISTVAASHVSDRFESGPTVLGLSQGLLSDLPLFRPEVLSLTMQMEHVQASSLASNPTSTSGLDDQRGSDKLHALKLAGDNCHDRPVVDNVTENDAFRTDVLVAETAEKLLVKDDLRLKKKTTVCQEMEKAWRPKVPSFADSAVDGAKSSFASNLKQPDRKSSFVRELSVGIAEKPGLISDEYKRQRAKMKEIALQRAVQLRREEDERIKEQKAHALSTLEELNQRSLPVNIFKIRSSKKSNFEGVIEKPAVVRPDECVKREGVETEVTVDDEHSSGTIRTGRRIFTLKVDKNGPNNHGKRERDEDRKSSKRSREEHRTKKGYEENYENFEEDSTATPEHAPSRITSQPSFPSQYPGFKNSPQMVSPQTKRALVGHRPRQARLQEIRHHRIWPRQDEGYASYSVEVDSLRRTCNPEANETDENAGTTRRTGPSPNNDSNDVKVILNDGLVRSGGNASMRKKKMKGIGKTKQKVDMLSVSAKFISNAHANVGLDLELTSSNDFALIGQGSEPVKALQSLVESRGGASLGSNAEAEGAEQSAAIGIAADAVMHLTSRSAVLSNRPQKRSQAARRVSRRDWGVSQDVRVSDKLHGIDGIIWAPVHPPKDSGRAVGLAWM